MARGSRKICKRRSAKEGPCSARSRVRCGHAGAGFTSGARGRARWDCGLARGPRSRDPGWGRDRSGRGHSGRARWDCGWGRDRRNRRCATGRGRGRHSPAKAGDHRSSASDWGRAGRVPPRRSGPASVRGDPHDRAAPPDCPILAIAAVFARRAIIAIAAVVAEGPVLGARGPVFPGGPVFARGAVAAKAASAPATTTALATAALLLLRGGHLAGEHGAPREADLAHAVHADDHDV